MKQATTYVLSNRDVVTKVSLFTAILICIVAAVNI